MLSSVNLVAYYTTLVLALFHATNVNAAPTRTTKRQVKNGNIAAPVARSNVAARLRQTSWREIQARDALRKSPFYRRQQASALPYATCQATYSSLVGVARYPNVEIYGGDPTPFEGGLFAQSETDCLNVCQSRADCIGYYYFAVDQTCYPKVDLAVDGWTTDTEGSQLEGSVAAIIGDCATANGAINPQFRSTCCNSPAVLGPSQCSPRVDAGLPVARLANVDLFGFDIPPAEEWQDSPLNSESDCITRCEYTEGCFGYFWWPQATDVPTCYLKQSGWGAADFLTGNAPSLAAGSTAGVIRQSCAGLQGILSEDVYLRCCNN
ncbi:hypothetical protein NCC49_004804 [Naganishia albida]|nr:hypothetical protein NCC49_004804 [Naganishia albida]